MDDDPGYEEISDMEIPPQPDPEWARITERFCTAAVKRYKVHLDPSSEEGEFLEIRWKDEPPACDEGEGPYDIVYEFGRVALADGRIMNLMRISEASYAWAHESGRPVANNHMLFCFDTAGSLKVATAAELDQHMRTEGFTYPDMAPVFPTTDPVADGYTLRLAAMLLHLADYAAEGLQPDEPAALLKFAPPSRSL
jgi:hypothetical protein